MSRCLAERRCFPPPPLAPPPERCRPIPPPGVLATPHHRVVPRPSPPHGRLCVSSLLLGAPSLRSVLALVILLAGGAAPAAAVSVDVAPISGLVTTESGGTATFTVVLGSAPTADVTIPVATSDPTEGAVSVATLTFTAADWDIPQTITVTGVDDAVQDGDIGYTIVLGAATSDDVNYSGVD